MPWEVGAHRGGAERFGSVLQLGVGPLTRWTLRRKLGSVVRGRRLIGFASLSGFLVQSSLFGNNWNTRIEPIVSRELNMVDLVDELQIIKGLAAIRNDDTCRVSLRSTYDAHMDDGSVSATNTLEHHFDGIDEEFGGADGGAASRRSQSSQ
ncbi:hypothetical protein OPV22_009627 [Ensete ventricosum]|uniref:Uncharacterized protein n=1 Tax=Ensete ventricosum TaxID=4639 RepID=A0AAV8PRY4_ENSVE|nr:hypothetical protein OPV22_009627 [Ensete ventricosum]